MIPTAEVSANLAVSLQFGIVNWSPFMHLAFCQSLGRIVPQYGLMLVVQENNFSHPDWFWKTAVPSTAVFCFLRSLSKGIFCEFSSKDFRHVGIAWSNRLASPLWEKYFLTGNKDDKNPWFSTFSKLIKITKQALAQSSARHRGVDKSTGGRSAKADA